MRVDRLDHLGRTLAAAERRRDHPVALGLLRAVEAECERRRDAIVAAMRERGASWREVGRALGVDHAVVLRRYRDDEPRPADAGQLVAVDQDVMEAVALAVPRPRVDVADEPELRSCPGGCGREMPANLHTLGQILDFAECHGCDRAARLAHARARRAAGAVTS